MKKIAAGALCLLLLLSGCGKAGPGPEQVREIYQNTLAAAHYRVRTYGGFSCEYLLELQEGENVSISYQAVSDSDGSSAAAAYSTVQAAAHSAHCRGCRWMR